jgi:hypothetical protein
MTVIEDGKEVHVDINTTVAVAVAQHRKELELAYVRRKQEFLKKYGMSSLPTNRAKTALEA